MQFTPSVFIEVINGYLPEPHSGLLNGIIFGVSLKTSKVFYEHLKIVGLLHIVVLSGINITLLVSMISSATKFFGKPISIMITMLTIILFVFFVGPQAPIVRAAIMGSITLVAILFGRRNLAFFSLFLSAVAIAIFQPRWISTVSFQLSFGATLGIILFGQSGSTSVIKNDLRTSLAAQIFTAPIIFLYFRQISLIAPFSNLLVAPLIPPLMVFGFTAAILGKIHYLLGLIPAYICYGLLSYMVFVIETLSKIPFVFFSF